MGPPSVQAAPSISFTKVCIIARANYQTLASSSAADIATAWKCKTMNDKMEEEEEGSFLVGSKGKDVIVAKQFKTIWFIAMGPTQKQTKENKGKSFSAARSAFPLICKTILDTLEESGV